MKKILLITFSILISQWVFAQPEIEYADIALVPQTVITVDSVDYIDLSQEVGANQTWDLSNLSGNTGTFQYSIVETGSTIFGASFPNSNYAYDVMDINFYFYADNSTFEDHGFGLSAQGFSMIQTRTNPKTVINFPLTYQSSGEDTFDGFTDFAGIFTSDDTGTRSWSVDGYGTLILPSGTYSDVLLVHAQESTESVQESLGITITTTSDVDEYIFYAAGYQMPLGIFSSVTTSDGVTEETTLSGAVLNSQSVSVAEVQPSELALSPNPASSDITINIPENMHKGVLQLISPSGEIIQKSALSEMGGTSLVLSVADLPRGTYVVQILGEIEVYTTKLILH